MAVAAFEIRRAGRHGRFQVLVELSQFVLGTQPLVGEGEVVDDGFHHRDEVVVEAARTAVPNASVPWTSEPIITGKVA